MSPPEKVNAQHSRAVAPQPFQSSDRWQWLCRERPGQEGSWQPFQESVPVAGCTRLPDMFMDSSSAARSCFTARDSVGLQCLKQCSALCASLVLPGHEPAVPWGQRDTRVLEGQQAQHHQLVTGGDCPTLPWAGVASTRVLGAVLGTTI